MHKTPLSVLELAIVRQGDNARTAIEGAVAMARHAEELDFTRIWMAEHHQYAAHRQFRYGCNRRIPWPV